ncbi:MAG: hypothetical protein KAV00_07795, partial [Phycisphaerae bacterium]|nr:hypothetical protein [Phycisphaerae bacterium]
QAAGRGGGLTRTNQHRDRKGAAIRPPPRSPVLRTDETGWGTHVFASPTVGRVPPAATKPTLSRIRGY